ncbi:hypothetical protein HJC10_23930 [Corallococcus exiguus]|uniref:hypothetical protein n=1 Tax=Corallococcus TaxID=83461 RepID=UPI000ED42D1C|nr:MULTISPECIES: hypothetical protein [Corallococcus]NNB86545.1 hypothetical protein [Corallococcus exiguus]NNB92738.1 hypothetical protein [Corallococcus exiguus]NNC05895.1 hypothetical protein [Corallococcus exiguus]NPC49603.1 hypothetical protein [Corallococcus exiguus]RKH77930.1 hypothetical protein D7X99_29950 [Corallococcus sp. AB032C]
MRWMQMLGGCLTVMALAACGSDGEGGQGKLKLREGQSLDLAQECGVDLPQCSQGLSCLVLKLDGVSKARCVDDSKVCTELVSCTGGTECAILDSYPGQVACSGKCTSDCDSSVSSSP